jgi:hypothetical protein
LHLTDPLQAAQFPFSLGSGGSLYNGQWLMGYLLKLPFEPFQKIILILLFDLFMHPFPSILVGENMIFCLKY